MLRLVIVIALQLASYSYCYSDSDEELHPAFKQGGLEGKQCLRYDILDYTATDPEVTREFAFKLAGCDSLFMSTFPLQDDGALALSEALAGNNKIEAINVFDCKLTEVGIKHLSSAFGPTLIALMLGKNAIGDEGAATLAEAFKRVPRLSVLDVSRSDIGYEGATALFMVLARHPVLSVLKLERNPSFGDEGAKELARALRANRELTIVDVSRCGITDVGARALLEALRDGAGPKLDVLGLQSNSISDELLTEIGDVLEQRGRKARDEEKQEKEEL